MCHLEDSLKNFFSWIDRSYPESKVNQRKGSVLVIAVGVPNNMSKNEILRQKCHLIDSNSSQNGNKIEIEDLGGVFAKVIIVKKNGKKETIGKFKKIPYLQKTDSVLKFIGVTGPRNSFLFHKLTL